jgi:hypothetical protein
VLFPRLAATLSVVALAGAASAGAQQKDGPGRPFAEVTKGSRATTGLFSLYSRGDAVLLSLAPSQLDRDFLLVTQISQGIGELGLDGGASVRSDLVRFHRQEDRIELWVINPHFTAPAGSAIGRAVAYSFGHSVAQAFPIAAVRDTSEILIDLTPFLLSDWADVGSVLQSAAVLRKIGGTVTLDDKRSSLQEARVFPANLEADVRLTFQGPKGLGVESVPDYRWIPIGIHYSMVQLPAIPMRPRLADERVGYFVSAMKDFSRDTMESFFVRYVNRWRLEKKDPGAPLSEPVQPITFYIDRTVPEEWRPYVRSGILEWNRAFAEAGFREAIRVYDAPDDSTWSAEDARYSTVRWTATNRSVYAIGPSNVDPRTGEILNADVLISAAWIQTWRGESGHYLTPVASVQSATAEDSTALGGTELCSMGEGLAREGTLTRTLLSGRLRLPAGAAVPQEYIGQALKALVMHEIGHTLGLRHNFRGSAGISATQLSDPGYTGRNGLGVSVMDYMPPAVSVDPRRQGDYYARTIGSYDRWAIRYGYADVGPRVASGGDQQTPGGGVTESTWAPEVELNGLRAIASESADPAHLYGSDEDAGFGGLGLDPTVSRYDQTDDPLGWARDRVTIINGLLDSLEARVVAPGQGYARLRSAFTDLLTDRWYAMMVTTKYLGGAFTARDHRGDPDGRPAFATVPLEQQREALAFLAEQGFGEGAYRFSPELLSRLEPDRWMHWGANPSAVGRIDFPLHDWAAAQQGALLGQLLDPAVLSRVRDAELRASGGEETIGLPELFATLTGTIWAEAYHPGTNVSSVRRDLQRMYLNRLLGLYLSPAPGTPEDARTLARASLVELERQLDHALDAKSHLDAYTRAHLDDSRERVDQGLKAPMLQTAASAK